MKRQPANVRFNQAIPVSGLNRSSRKTKSLRRLQLVVLDRRRIFLLLFQPLCGSPFISYFQPVRRLRVINIRRSAEQKLPHGNVGLLFFTICETTEPVRCRLRDGFNTWRVLPEPLSSQKRCFDPIYTLSSSASIKAAQKISSGEMMIMLSSTDAC